jgi:hypothetical protein
MKVANLQARREQRAEKQLKVISNRKRLIKRAVD